MNKFASGPISIIAICLVLVGCGGVSTTHNSPQGSTQDSQVPRSGIKNLIIVVMQNSSFDHLFGTYPDANGPDASVPNYQQADHSGKMVSPVLLSNLSPLDLPHTQASYQVAYDSGKMDKYAWENGDIAMGYYNNSSVGTADDGRQFGVNKLWSYAQQYALADNFFASAMASEPSNMLYMVAADVGTDNDPFGYPQLDACSSILYQQNQEGGATITPPLNFQSVGDQLSAVGTTWAFAQESFSTTQLGDCTAYVPQENPFQYFQSTANSANVRGFSLNNFGSELSSGTVPSVLWIQPAPGHSMHPGSGNIANGIEWLDDLVQSVKNSPIWPNSAILVVWDESGGWYDHVAPPQLSGTLGLGARVPVLLISPFAKTNYISSQQMDFVSILRFIQWNWALGQFGDAGQAAREAQSGDICDLLNTTCAGP
ncbi:MAG TPA: alkaline phosphatase family protein [Terriglobales bacterium]|nr:alkaline phosphatase family protein [Terriglobales bacterium]